ncbi:MAG: uncharacterized protein JWN93_2756 [Hyphomicrobiales bacterium]|jgi:hypothetical protein|nr:uncharacterized protein [Hyphomicrobiales bacterium]
MFKTNDIDHGIAPILVPLAAALLALAMFAGPSQAQEISSEKLTYVIPAGGYGVDECVSTASECGLIVANAWCEAHGHSAAKAFGSASDLTFSANLAQKAPQKGSIVITCGE